LSAVSRSTRCPTSRAFRAIAASSPAGSSTRRARTRMATRS